MKPSGQPLFLPVCTDELRDFGIQQPDIIFVSGDAYVDHPSFASALLGRVLWAAGYVVLILPQPDYKDETVIQEIGPPRLYYAISGGSVDSMVSNFTAARKRRSNDAYSPGGKPRRPDRAVLVYTDLIHRSFPKIPIVIGGIEASLRRFAHYDYWSDKIRQSILADAPADILVYGMGEHALCELALRLDQGEQIQTIRDIQGTVWKLPPKEYHETMIQNGCEIPSYTRVHDNPKDFCMAHREIVCNQNPFVGKTLIQRHPKTIIVQNLPSMPLTTEEMDTIYGLPFKRTEHPSYTTPVPALKPVQFSIISHRGCYGNCHFCALSMHQGKIIQSRSKKSILQEIESFKNIDGFSGIISDVGGPSANMYGAICPAWKTRGACSDRECITCPSTCQDILGYLDLLDEAEKIPGVKHVFIGSGLRYDLIPQDLIIFERISKHISGQMKVAPEHIVSSVTSLMNKPDKEHFEQFRRTFEELQIGIKHRQYLIPYLMSGHPGCTLNDMIVLAEYVRDTKMYTKQVQDFTPTPLTTSTCMYATGIDPYTNKPVHIPKGEEKKIQRSLLHWKEPENYDLVSQGLTKAGRTDLIGTEKNCFIIPKKRRNVRNFQKTH